MKIGTLFSGGLAAPEQAIKQMKKDHEVVFACEYDKFARQNYLANHKVPNGHFHKDINDMDGTEYIGKVDIIVGGSPCQAFSISGLRRGLEDKRGKLIWQYFRIIKEARPKYFIYENVKGMISDNNGKTIKDFIEVFRSIGYYCHFSVLNTKDYGVPQNRERVYIVGFLDYDEYLKFEFEKPKPLTMKLKDILEDDVDEKYYIKNDKMIKFILDEKRQKKKYVQINGDIAVTQQARQYASWNGDYINVVGLLDIKGNEQIRRVYGINGVSPTLTTMEGGNRQPKILHHASCSFEHNNFVEDSYTIRKLTPRECFRLQGCDDSFKIEVSDSQAYKIAGNAMSVNILEMIFRSLDNVKSCKKENLFDFMEAT